MTRTRDLLGELELTMVPSLICRRRFWCSIEQREVEVEFETVPRRLLGTRIAGVKSCTVFEEPTAVTCDRACLDGRFRSQWPDSLRVGP